MTVFPHSPVIDATPTQADINTLAEEALNAFFAVVCDKLNDWYPGTVTTGDIDPWEAQRMSEQAQKWVDSFATNNPAVYRATEKLNLTDYDFRLQREGSLVILHPQNDAAREWIDVNVYTEQTQWWGGGIVVEHRYIDGILEGIEADGLDITDPDV